MTGYVAVSIRAHGRRALSTATGVQATRCRCIPEKKGGHEVSEDGGQAAAVGRYRYAVHLHTERFDFASVLAPFNWTMLENPDYARDFAGLLDLCRERDVAVQTIKSIARRRWDGPPARAFSWYEPLRDPDAIQRAVHFVLARPGLFLATSSDATLLRTTLEAASEPIAAPGDDRMRADAEALGIAPLFVRDVAEEVGLAP